MYRIVLKLVFFLSLLYPCGAFCQDQINTGTVAADYNKWLTSLQLNKLVVAQQVISPSQTDPHYTIILVPAPVYKTPEDIGKAWIYFKDGFEEQHINLPLLLFHKFGSIINLPTNKIRLIIRTAKPETFSLEVVFNKELIINEKLGSVRGGDIAVDYNFEAPPLMSILSRTYDLKTPIASLKPYYNKWKTFFAKSKHPAGDSVRVSPIYYEDGVIKMVVANIYKDITAEEYYEMIVIEFVILHPRNKPAQLNYGASVFYAAKAKNKMPPLTAFKDIADEPELAQQLQDYKTKLEKQLQTTFNVNP